MDPARGNQSKPTSEQPLPPPGGLTLAGCSRCASGLFGPHDPLSPYDVPYWPPGYGAQGCTQNPCVPGRPVCHPCLAHTKLGHAACALYECLCCVDPCYEPRWRPVADAAFFVEAPRPQSQMRLRWDHGRNLILPDRNEYFWPRADGQGKGPQPVAPFKVEPRLRYNELVLVTEAAVGAFSMISELPYRAVDPTVVPRAANFGDLVIGTKSLLYDCELLQLSLLFKTYILTGNFLKGLGVGHVSLEPSLLLGVKLAPETYLQMQISEWIPLGGDPTYAGPVLHFHGSLNQVLLRLLPDVPLVGTLEMSGWVFQSGAYTDPLLGSFQRSSGEAYLAPGFGLRLFICDRIDLGLGAAFAVTERHFAEQLYRSEFRVRY